jgi:hypothetical protein
MRTLAYSALHLRLLIYGSKESDPIYANSCANAIVALNLTEHVFLCGLANPSVALPEGWLFINSSISEGLSHLFPLNHFYNLRF